jgi:hypothetical protein
MSTLTQEERDAMKEDNAATESVGENDEPIEESSGEEAQRNDVASTASAPQAADASLVDTNSEQALDTGQATEKSTHGEVAAGDTAPAQTRTQPIPRYDARLPDDFDAQVKALADKELNLKQQFKAGEIEFDEFEQARSDLLVQREQLTIAKTKAEISQEMNAQTAEQLWVHAVNEFMSDTAKLSGAAGGIDYRKDAEKASDLDGFVRSLAARSEHAHQSMAWFLTEAHKRVLALHGIATKTPADQTTDSDSAAKPPVKSVDRKPPLDIAPKTLAMIPGGEGPGDVDGEFADVLALEGLAYEQAIARMSSTERERFLRAA